LKKAHKPILNAAIPSTKVDALDKRGKSGTSQTQAKPSIAPTIKEPASIRSSGVPPQSRSASPELGDNPYLYGNDLKTVQESPDPAVASTVATALDKQGRRRCEFCNAMVKPENYGRHRKREHGDAVMANIPAR